MLEKCVSLMLCYVNVMSCWVVGALMAMLWCCSAVFSGFVITAVCCEACVGSALSVAASSALGERCVPDLFSRVYSSQPGGE